MEFAEAEESRINKLPPPFNELEEGDTPCYTGSQVLQLVAHFEKLDNTNHVLWNLIQKQRLISSESYSFQFKRKQSAPESSASTSTAPDESSTTDLAQYSSDLDAFTQQTLGSSQKENVEPAPERQKRTRLSDIYDHYSGNAETLISETNPNSLLPDSLSDPTVDPGYKRPASGKSKAKHKPPLPSIGPPFLPSQPQQLQRQASPYAVLSPSTPSPTNQGHTSGLHLQSKVKLMPSDSSPFTRPWTDKSSENEKRPQTSRAYTGGNGGSSSAQIVHYNSNRGDGASNANLNQNTHDALLRLERKNAPSLKLKPEPEPLSHIKSSQEKRGLRLSRSANAIRDLASGYISPSRIRFPQQQPQPRKPSPAPRYEGGSTLSSGPFGSTTGSIGDPGIESGHLVNPQLIAEPEKQIKGHPTPPPEQGMVLVPHTDHGQHTVAASRLRDQISLPALGSPNSQRIDDLEFDDTIAQPGTVPNVRSNRSITGASEYYLNPKLQPFTLPLSPLPLPAPSTPAIQHNKSSSNPEAKRPKDHRNTEPPQKTDLAPTSFPPTSPLQQHQPQVRDGHQQNSHQQQSSLNPYHQSPGLPHNQLPENESTYSLGESIHNRSVQNQSFPSIKDPIVDSNKRSPLTSLLNIDIEVKGSQIELDKRGNQVITFLINVIEFKESTSISFIEALAEPQKAMLWVVKKLYSDFLTLDQEIRKWKGNDSDVQTLPDMSVFKKTTSKGYRKSLLEDYLKWAIRSSQDCDSLKHFLSIDIVDETKNIYKKEGYLYKTGRNLGGVKRRYYVCNAEEKVLEYYDRPGGSRSGTISLEYAVVKTERLSATDHNKASGAESLHRLKIDPKASKQFRHAFLIEERPKRLARDPSTHVLKATSDKERDEWVMVIGNIIRSVNEEPTPNLQERKPIFKRLRPSLSRGTRDQPENDSASVSSRTSNKNRPNDQKKSSDSKTSQNPSRGGSRPRSLSYPPPQLNMSEKRVQKKVENKSQGMESRYYAEQAPTLSDKSAKEEHRSHSSLTSLDHHDQFGSYSSFPEHSSLSIAERLDKQKELDASTRPIAQSETNTNIKPQKSSPSLSNRTRKTSHYSPSSL